MDIMMRLKGSGFSAIAQAFREREQRLGTGLPLQDFVEIVLQGLPRTTSKEEKYKNVSSVVDLFEDIDINGDGMLEFDEFTSFCVDAGMAATRLEMQLLKHKYIRNDKRAFKTAKGCIPASKIKWLPQFKLLLVIENQAHTVKLFSKDGKLVHEVHFASVSALLTKPPVTEVEPAAHTSSIQPLPDTTHKSQEGMTSVNEGIFILDAVCITKFQWLAMSTTDFAISFYDMNNSKEAILSKVLPGSNLLSTKTVFEPLNALTITTTVAQSLLRYCDEAELLFSAGNDYVINVWKLIDRENKVLWKQLIAHTTVVMDLVEVPEQSMIASCDIRGVIQLWDVTNCQSRGALVGHTRGVRQLVYSKRHDLLLSAGYEFEALGWDVASRQLVLRLSGHRAPLVGIQLTLFQTDRAITVDMDGVVKMWDISRESYEANNTGGSSQGRRGARSCGASYAVQIETIEPVHKITRFQPTTFVSMYPQSRDLWVATNGTSTLYAFTNVRVQQFEELPLHAFYHRNANKFVVVCSSVCSLWDGETGKCTNEFTHVAPQCIPRSSEKERKELADSLVEKNENGVNRLNNRDAEDQVWLSTTDTWGKKLIVATENGGMGVYNCLNFVQMRCCDERFGETSDRRGQTVNLRCALVGLHYCYENKLIIATDAGQSSIIVVDDRSVDSLESTKQSSVLRRLTHIPGGIALSAYDSQTGLVAIVSEDHTLISLWDIEMLSLRASFTRTTDKEKRAPSITSVSFWEEFPILLVATANGDMHFYSTMRTRNCESAGLLLYSFSNKTGLDLKDKAHEESSTFITEPTLQAAKFLSRRLHRQRDEKRKKEDSGVSCLKVIYDNQHDRYLLFTGDEDGVVRVRDISPLAKHHQLIKASEAKRGNGRTGKNPYVVFNRDYTRELAYQKNASPMMANRLLLNGNQPKLGDTSRLPVTQTDLKRLARTRLDDRNRSTASSSAKYSLNQNRKSSNNANASIPSPSKAAVSAAVAFLSMKSGVKKSDTKSALSLLFQPKSSSRYEIGNEKVNTPYDPEAALVPLLHIWKAHDDQITSFEISKQPDILITCSLDTRVYIWNWKSKCLGKLFDSENVTRSKWHFRKDDSRRFQERDELVKSILRNIELDPKERESKRRQTLIDVHISGKCQSNTRRVSKLLLDHIADLNSRQQNIVGNKCGNQKSTFQQSSSDNKLVKSENTADTEEPKVGEHLVSTNTTRPNTLAQLHRSSPATSDTAEQEFMEVTKDFRMNKQYMETELGIELPPNYSGLKSKTTSQSVFIKQEAKLSRDKAEATIQMREFFRRKTEGMYVHLRQVQRPKTSIVRRKDRSKNGDAGLFAPSELLKQHFNEDEYQLRPHTAPGMASEIKYTRTTNKKWPKLDRLDHNVGAASSMKTVKSQTVLPTRRRSSLDLHFIEEVKRHQMKGKQASLDTVRTVDHSAESSKKLHSHKSSSMSKLEVINSIIGQANDFIEKPEHAERKEDHTLERRSITNVDSTNFPVNSTAFLQTLKEEDDDLENDGEGEVDMITAKGDAEAQIRLRLEATKLRMESAMRDGGRLQNIHQMQKQRQADQNVEKVRRMEDYLQQKRRELNTNIGNVFKKTSFVFQSSHEDEAALSTITKDKSTNKTDKSGAMNFEENQAATATALAKQSLDMKNTFGAYSVREVMSVVRLFWSMDEDLSGSISLPELLEYRHYFEQLGYSDMTTVFQTIDKDGNGDISLRELLETCFQYANKYQIDEMLKLAKLGSVRSYLNGCKGQSQNDSEDLSPELRKELMDVFHVFDKDNDGGVSIEEIMEALRVDDDDVMARVIANRKTRRRGSNVSASGITKDDILRLYEEFDTDGNKKLDFNEFAGLMRSIYTHTSGRLGLK